MAKTDLTLSLTEIPQFRRLVQFVGEVRTHALTADDPELDGLVESLDADLREMAA